MGLTVRTVSPMTAVEDKFTHRLRLAREICIGLAAFFVSPEGDIRINQLSGDQHPDLDARVGALARSCLSHPSARGGELFWNARIVTDSDLADDSLACVAIALQSGGTWLGLLGVADTWLPELDGEQRRSLASLAQDLTAGLVSGEIEIPSAAAPAATEPPAATPIGTVSYPAEPVEPVEPTVQAEPGEQASELLSSLTPEESFLSEVAEHLPDALVVAQDDGTIIYANSQFSAMTGLAPDDILGSDLTALVTDDAPTLASHGIESLFGTPSPGRRLSISIAQSESVEVDVSGSQFTSDVVGSCHVGLVREVSTAVGESMELSVHPQPFSELLDALDEGILVCDANSRVVIANRAARLLQGFQAEEPLVGEPLRFSPELRLSDGTPLPDSEHALVRSLIGTVVHGDPLLFAPEGGGERHLVVSARPYEVEGSTGALLVLRDATPQVQSEAWLTHLAMHDPLTGLANRHLLIDYLQRMLGETENRGGSVSLIFLDLDNFKNVNDQYGHEVGDQILVAVGERVVRSVRPSDVVARLGGDEFVVAHVSSSDAHAIETIVSRVRKSLAAPFTVGERVLAVSASVGYVTTTSGGDDPLSLLVRADREMFRKKSSGRGHGTGAART